MDTYARRKLIAAVILFVLMTIGLIGEAMRDRTLRNGMLACLFAIGGGIAVIMLAVWLLVGRAHAHDHARPDLDDWYRSLNSGKGPCCDGREFDTGTATTLDDPDWENNSGHYRVRIEGEWVDVDDSAVVNVPNRDGRAIVWFYHVDGHPVARCFMPGAGT